MSRICPHCFADIDDAADLDHGLLLEILDVIADRLVVRPDQILSHNRSARVVDARNAAIAVCSQLFGLSSTELGRVFNRDHSTILHSLRKADSGLVAVLVDDMAGLAPRRSRGPLRAVEEATA